MSPSGRNPRSAEWLENLGEWSWPGQRVAAEVMPPAWVPAQPPVLAPAPAPLPAPWVRARRLVIAVLLAALAAVGGALALRDGLGLGARAAVPRALPASSATQAIALPLPRYVTVSTDRAGSTIEKAGYRSVALHRQGSYYVYLPPGYEASQLRYPVIYLLHGNSQKATAFLQIGIQAELDRLIAAHAIPPMIAVMIQGGPGANNWRNINSQHYESYVLEVQELVDRTLASLPERGARAIAGLSMGGYGAMELTLDNPYRFSVVESWLGFFDGLDGRLRLDRHAIRALGLHAFLYGGAQDKIANPSEDAPFAAGLREAGAKATAAVYPGEHNLETVQAHLSQMLTFAGRSLSGAVSDARR